MFHDSLRMQICKRGVAKISTKTEQTLILMILNT